jgi:pyruvate formate lyase activating enzyme
MDQLESPVLDQLESAKGLIFEIQKMSTEDGPGIRTTVFFNYCPLKCAWCHNPESIERTLSLQWFKIKCIGCKSCLEVCPSNALMLDPDGMHIDRERCTVCGACVEECPSTALKIFGKWWDIDALVTEVAKDQTYYEKSGGGVTASGGEATVQIPFLREFFRKCKDRGISTALDTCGYVNQSVLEQLLPVTNLILYDLKEIDPVKHAQFTGVNNDLIQQNIIWLVENAPSTNTKIWIRTPIIPGYTATDENIRGIAAFISDKLNGKIDRWDLLAFNSLGKSKYERMNKDYPLKDGELLTKDQMDHFLMLACSTGLRNVYWSGLTKK